MSFVFPAETDGRLWQRLRLSRLLAAASQKFQQTSGLEDPFVRLHAAPPADALTAKAGGGWGVSMPPLRLRPLPRSPSDHSGRLGGILNVSPGGGLWQGRGRADGHGPELP